MASFIPRAGLLLSFMQPECGSRLQGVMAWAGGLVNAYCLRSSGCAVHNSSRCCES